MSELLFLTIGVFVLLLVSLLLCGYDFFSPSFIVCLIFELSSILALYATISWDVPEDYFSPMAIFIILSGIFVFIITEQMIRMMYKKNVNISSENNITQIICIRPYKLVLLIVFCIMASFLCVVSYWHYIRLNGYGGGFDFQSIASFYHRLTFIADKEGGMARWVRWLQMAEMSIIFIFMYIFMNNVVGCKDKIIRNSVYLVPMICWIPNMLMTSSRSFYLQLAGAIVFFGYVSMCRRNRWSKMRKNYRRILIYSCAALITILIAFYAMVANGAIGRSANKTFLDYITIYLGAPIIHFNQFITNPPADVSYFGQETFGKMNSVLLRLGLVKNAALNQLEVRNIVGIYSGNVYTFFRRPYHDFGLIGMYVFVALTAGLFSHVYYKKIFGLGQSFRNDRTLVLYGYYFYIIYLFPVMCEVCNLVYFGTVYFLIIFYLVYGWIFGNWGINHHFKLFIRKQ